MLRAGFIGLGSQGSGMARRIIETGMPTTLWARNEKSLDPYLGKAAFAPDPAELGRASDVVGICVTDGAAVRAVALGEHGVLAGMAPGTVLAIHSTIGTQECDEIEEAAAARGVLIVDAPVSGGGAAAAEGRLTVYVGGTDEAVERARPALETYGNPVLHMGELGCGLRAKLMNNILNAAHFALAHDAMEIGTALGLDKAKLGDALTHGSGRSFSLEVFVGMGSFDPIADHVGPLLRKDVGLFSRETQRSTACERDVLLGAADRFLSLVEHPRDDRSEPVWEESG